MIKAFTILSFLIAMVFQNAIAQDCLKKADVKINGETLSQLCCEKDVSYIEDGAIYRTTYNFLNASGSMPAYSIRFDCMRKTDSIYIKVNITNDQSGYSEEHDVAELSENFAPIIKDYSFNDTLISPANLYSILFFVESTSRPYVTLFHFGLPDSANTFCTVSTVTRELLEDHFRKAKVNVQYLGKIKENLQADSLRVAAFERQVSAFQKELYGGRTEMLNEIQKEENNAPKTAAIPFELTNFKRYLDSVMLGFDFNRPGLNPAEYWAKMIFLYDRGGHLQIDSLSLEDVGGKGDTSWIVNEFLPQLKNKMVTDDRTFPPNKKSVDKSVLYRRLQKMSREMLDKFDKTAVDIIYPANREKIAVLRQNLADYINSLASELDEYKKPFDLPVAAFYKGSLNLKIDVINIRLRLTADGNMFTVSAPQGYQVQMPCIDTRFHQLVSRKGDYNMKIYEVRVNGIPVRNTCFLVKD